MWGDASLWWKIADANGLTGQSAIGEGTRLFIPAGVQRNENNSQTFRPYDPMEVLGATAPTTVESSGEITYVVKSGDTLSRIASQHSTTVPAIKRLNNLSTDRITVNQKLKIPVKAPAPVPPVSDPLAPTTVR